MKFVVVQSCEEAEEAFQKNSDTALEFHSHSLIGDEGCEAIAHSPALPNNTALRILNLGGQQIGPKGAQILGAALCKNFVLKELHLHNNKLMYEGVELMCRNLTEPIAPGKQPSKGPKLPSFKACGKGTP